MQNYSPPPISCFYSPLSNTIPPNTLPPNTIYKNTIYKNNLDTNTILPNPKLPNTMYINPKLPNTMYINTKLSNANLPNKMYKNKLTNKYNHCISKRGTLDQIQAFDDEDTIDHEEMIKRPAFYSYIFTVLIVIIISVIIAIYGFNSYLNSLNVPSWSLNKWLLLIIWTILVISTIYVAYRTHSLSRAGYQTWANVFFFLQALLVVLWVFFFFGAHNLNLTVFVTVLLLVEVIVWMIFVFHVDTISFYILFVYMLVLVYLVILMINIARLN